MPFLPGPGPGPGPGLGPRQWFTPPYRDPGGAPLVLSQSGGKSNAVLRLGLALLPADDLYPAGADVGTNIGNGIIRIGTVGFRETGTHTAAMGLLFLVGVDAGTDIGDNTVGSGTVGVRSANEVAAARQLATLGVG